MKIIIICSTSFPSIEKMKQKGKLKGIIFRYFKGQKLPLVIFENRFFSLLLSWANYYNAGILLLFACLKCISFLQPWDNKTCNIQAHPLTCLSTSTLRQGLHFFSENISVIWFCTDNSFCMTLFRYTNMHNYMYLHICKLIQWSQCYIFGVAVFFKKMYGCNLTLL